MDRKAAKIFNDIILLLSTFGNDKEKNKWNIQIYYDSM